MAINETGNIKVDIEVLSNVFTSINSSNETFMTDTDVVNDIFKVWDTSSLTSNENWCGEVAGYYVDKMKTLCDAGLYYYGETQSILKEISEASENYSDYLADTTAEIEEGVVVTSPGAASTALSLIDKERLDALYSGDSYSISPNDKYSKVSSNGESNKNTVEVSNNSEVSSANINNAQTSKKDTVKQEIQEPDIKNEQINNDYNQYQPRYENNNYINADNYGDVNQYVEPKQTVQTPIEPSPKIETHTIVQPQGQAVQPFEGSQQNADTTNYNKGINLSNDTEILDFRVSN